jgi:hypothetical protein
VTATGGASASGGHDVAAVNAAGFTGGGGVLFVRGGSTEGGDPVAAVGVALAALGDPGADEEPLAAGTAATGVPETGVFALGMLARAFGAEPPADEPLAPPLPGGMDSTGGGCVLSRARAPSVSGMPGGASLTT